MSENGVFIIVGWSMPDDACVMMDSGGGAPGNAIFKTKREAECWADENCAFNWTVVRLL